MIPAIDIEKLSVAFQSKTGATHALQELTLSVSPGIVFGFLGPNGAGKTTTIHVLLGFQAATSGTAKIFGQSVTDAVARHRIGYLSENPDAYSFLTGRELLTMAGNLFGLPPSEIKRRVNVLILEAGLSFAADRRIASYSRGMRQRICMAQALINDPDLLILDEPTGGLDPLGRLEVRTLITSLKERGKTVFFSSHELSEVELICDRIAILANGRLLAEGPLGSIVPAGENLERFFTNTVTRRTDLAAPL